MVLVMDTAMSIEVGDGGGDGDGLRWVVMGDGHVHFSIDMRHA